VLQLTLEKKVHFKLKQIKRDKMWWNRGIQFNKADHESRIFKQYYRHKKYGCQAIWTLLCMYRLLIAVPTVVINMHF